MPYLAGAGGVTAAWVDVAISRALREVTSCFMENHMVFRMECVDVGLGRGN